MYAISTNLFLEVQDFALKTDIGHIWILAVMVLTYNCFVVQSLFLGSIGVSQIIMSIPIATIIQVEIFGITYFSQMQIFVIILIMGVGADNIFVLNDMWERSGHIKAIKNRLPLRVSHTFRKAMGAMFVTSLTTAASFLATALTPMMPIISFAIYAALVVMVNYSMVVLIYPSIWMFYEKHIKKRFRCFTWSKRSIKRAYKWILKRKEEIKKVDEPTK